MTVDAFISTIIAVVAFAGSVCSLFFLFKNNRRTDNSDIIANTKETTMMNVKLDMISQSTMKIENSLQKMSDKVEEHGKQIVILDAKVDALHKRVDTMEGKVK